MKKPFPTQPAPTNDEDEVLRRMLNTPPTPHKVPAKKAAKKRARKAP